MTSAEKMRQWRRANPDRARAISRSSVRKNRFGISAEQFD